MNSWNVFAKSNSFFHYKVLVAGIQSCKHIWALAVYYYYNIDIKLFSVVVL